MSAMSASPVKPVLPPGVPSTTVNAPVPPSPPKSMPLPPSLTVTPNKPANMNHSVMPLSLISEHKNIPVGYPLPLQSQQQSSVPPSVQPLPRTVEKPRELAAPGILPISIVRPTSNGMEGLKSITCIPSPLPTPVPAATPTLTPIPIPITTPLPMPPVNLNPHVEQSMIPSLQVSLKPELVPSNTLPPPQDNQATDKSMNKSDTPSSVKVPDATPAQSNNTATEVHPITPMMTAPSVPLANNTCPEVLNSSVSTAGAPMPPTLPSTTTSLPTTATDLTTSQGSALPVTATSQGSAPPITATSQSTSVTMPTPADPPKSEAITVKARSESSLPKPELKVATIIPRGSKRKRETKPAPAPLPVSNKKETTNSSDERKSKRVRLPTQPYQSPLPELNIIAKLNKPTPVKAIDDKLIIFYKNEFLAVRNADGGFYVCQALQNIYKSSPRIRIRWLSQQEDNLYSPDFYDQTDFDCILTNLNLERVDKEKFRLPIIEQHRTESILKRALDVEKGVSEKPPVTEEHPDGLDLSLYRDESQLKKSAAKSRSKGSTSVKKSEEPIKETDKSEDDEKEDDEDDEEDEPLVKRNDNDNKKKKQSSAPKTSKKKKKPAKKKKPPPTKKAAPVSAPAVKKTVAPPTKKKVTPSIETRMAPKRKASVASATQPLEKRSKKPETSSQASDRSSKTRSGK
uniref:Uncharacterized protein n=1 Tax=Clastoptera arizonana TaxID=38151 RepID=A0A1B6D5E6_9HEMI